MALVSRSAASAALAGLLALAGCSRAKSGAVQGPAPSATATVSHAEIDAGVPSAPPPPPPDPPRCEETPGVAIFTSPANPAPGLPLRVVALTDKPLVARLSVRGAAGAALVESATRRGGPPYFWTVELTPDAAGAVDVTLEQVPCEAGANATRSSVKIGRTPVRAPGAPREAVWTAQGRWSRTWENLYSAWVEALFDAPDGEVPSWPALHEVLRDPKRNFLFDHLGVGEDGAARAPVIRPDCADLPYFLRAYFAYKLRLPFGLGECNRGGGGAPPSCNGVLVTSEAEDERASAKAKDGGFAAFGAFLRGTVADKVHSGSARAPFEEERADYYPVPITWASLRPGTIFADPYGHVLVVAKRTPQTPERGGVLFAVDGQPDGTVARKRFWRGNFLYATQRELGGPGFKRFRPVVRRGGKLTRASDAMVKADPEYGDLSREAQQLDVEGFYDAMDDVLSPRPLDPERAMMETLAALEEQVKTRVQSVDNGRRWVAEGKPPATMPEGPEIFETSGAWEDFSTPSRDLRLLIAIDVVRGFPARVARRPTRYAMPPGASVPAVQARLEKLLESELSSRKIGYTRTDGSVFTLTLADVVARASALEVAYNPNECAELRWGAPTGSDEAATCRARAPSEQRARMESYRAWFRERRRPPRK